MQPHMNKEKSDSSHKAPAVRRHAATRAVDSGCERLGLFAQSLRRQSERKLAVCHAERIRMAQTERAERDAFRTALRDDVAAMLGRFRDTCRRRRHLQNQQLGAFAAELRNAVRERLDSLRALRGGETMGSTR